MTIASYFYMTIYNNLLILNFVYNKNKSGDILPKIYEKSEVKAEN